MILFFSAAAVLIIVTLVFLLPPLLRRTSAPQEITGDGEANLAILRDQLRELHRDRENGLIDDASYEEARHDLRLRAVHDAAPQPAATVRHSGSGPMPWLIAAGVPLAALALYVLLGNPLALIPTEAGLRGDAHQNTQLSMEEMVASLAKRLEAQPGDVDGWDMLARSYNVMGEFEKASQAYEKLAALRPDDAQLLADYADTLAMAKGQSLQGEPKKLIDRALILDPNNLKALALAGTAAFERKQYDQAIAAWEKILPIASKDSEIARSTMLSIDEAKRLSGGSQAEPAVAEIPALQPEAVGKIRIQGRVEIDSDLRPRLADTDTVFVLARAQEGGPPLAVIRREVRDLPFDFVLDERSGMMGSRSLADVSEVTVIARVSRSGKAERVPGEPETVLGPVAPGGEPLRLVLQ